ncbi:MAG TPA: hypothetical protein VNJ07_14965 [Chitinophagales bacterium]|nr:hypothetical protein [Chitinophagales bacterium]
MRFVRFMNYPVALVAALFSSTVYFAYAGSFDDAVGARASALGNHTSALSDGFSVHNNQAGIGFLKKFSFGISAKNKFLVKELTVADAAAIFPTKTGVFGLGIHYTGTSPFSERKIGAAFAKNFGNRFSFGLQFDYLNISISEYGSKNLFTFEAGLQFFLVQEKLLIGAHINNPLRLTINEDANEKLPTVMRFGLNYMPSKKVAALAEVEKDIDYAPVYKFGLEYLPVEKLAIRGGVNASPFQGFFGVGLILKNVVIDAASALHPVLGVSPQISIAYAIRKEDK